ncbi:unnamed protein product [Hydatigera taeniaeformis]|uniref:Folate_rec domain-containing protein n=1 Tax=Hydatigena taeniaeformis TaxID=6205 RepID=A0A0R3WW82_HYDTA|nr:unnamed protein product [Hydatigera taeniaeformis]
MSDFVLVLLICFSVIAVSDAWNRLLYVDTVEKYLDMCPESGHLKEHPSPEPDLDECTEWKDRTCCPRETATLIASATLHGFSFNFCENMSKPCRDFFHYDYCMIKCSPDLGPWIVKLTSSRFKERAFRIPLCESDCNAWYEACKEDKACAINWRSGGFDWSEGTNKCRDGFTCVEISKLYGSAKTFCEHVWDHSYRVVPVESVAVWNSSDKHCMHIPRGGGDPNAPGIVRHNHEVARLFATSIIKRVYGGEN